MFTFKKYLISFLFSTCVFSSSFAQTPAFPGAEGGGMYTTGGRGGKVLYVTNLNDNNEEGSLRWAISQKYPRTVLFKISGIIALEKPLVIRNGDITIAGQSAPGDGICIKDHEFLINADNVIIRYMRFRLGDKEAQNQPDAFGGKWHKNIIVDHCSMSWSIDECASFLENENFTMQWCLIAESLNESLHNKGKHGYGGIWGGKNASFHHNLLAHHISRNPRFNGWKRFGMKYQNAQDEEHVDFRNNVMYNYGEHATYGGEGGKYNVVGNYYKYGPGTKPYLKNKFLQIDIDQDTINYLPGYGIFYLEGNYVYGNEVVTNDNWKGVKYAAGVNPEKCKALEAFPAYPVSRQVAGEAYEKVLFSAGASFVRDTVDRRIVEEVRTGTATYKGSKSGLSGLIDSQEDVGGWPEYKSKSAPEDSDNDGIPDKWLKKNYKKKKATDFNEDGYTYLEVYLNSLVD